MSNDVPGPIVELAASLGRSQQHRHISAGGALLRKQWSAGEAANTIVNGRYDDVVIQEQGTLPVKNAKRIHENIRLFDEVITASRTKTVLYMTCARLQVPET